MKSTVLLVSTAQSFGGGEKYVQQVSNIYRDLGLDVHLVVRCPELYDKLQKDNFYHVQLVSSLGGFIGAIKQIYYLRPSLKRGFVHLNGHRDIVLSPLLTLLGIKSIAYRHTELVRSSTAKNYIKLCIYMIFLLFPSRLVCVSKHIATHIPNFYFYPRKIVIPNWLPTTDSLYFSNSRIKDTITRILIVARLDPLKGHSTLFDATANLSNIQIDVVGDGDQLLLTKYMHRDDIVFHGFQKNVSNFYLKSDIFVLPSYTEGSPFSVLEAMASGLAVVVSDIPTLRELVVDSHNGLLFKVGDSDALRNVLIDLIKYPDKQKHIGDNAMRFILEERLASSAMADFKGLVDSFV